MKALVTLAVGDEWKRIGDITFPRMSDYAWRHGYSFHVHGLDILDQERPPSWWKIEAIMRAFMEGCDTALWIDADVLVAKFERDILADCGDAHTAAVATVTKAHGRVPNCGVWVVHRGFWARLLRMNGRGNFSSSGHIWEQAAYIKELGGNPEQYPISVQESHLWRDLPKEWNAVPFDERGFDPERARFLHATGTRNLEEKVRLLEGWAAR